MSNRYGITKDSESVSLPHGVMTDEIMTLPEVYALTVQGNELTREYIRALCGLDEDVELDKVLTTVTVNHILNDIQNRLDKSNCGLHIIRPHVIPRVGYKKRI